MKKMAQIEIFDLRGHRAYSGGILKKNNFWRTFDFDIFQDKNGRKWSIFANKNMFFQGMRFSESFSEIYM